MVAAGGSDTTAAVFAPVASGADTARFTFTTDAPGSPHTVVVLGQGQVPSAAGGDDEITAWALQQDGPNPFAATTRIRYRLPRPAAVRLEVFDLHGRRVAMLVEGEQAAGEHAVPFGSGARTAGGGRLGTLPAGVYFCRLQAGDFSATRKVVLAR
jgi:hypothetical protein